MPKFHDMKFYVNQVMGLPTGEYRCEVAASMLTEGNECNIVMYVNLPLDPSLTMAESEKLAKKKALEALRQAVTALSGSGVN